jgi:Ice-binding-like/PEP-CTERM motif
MKATLLLTAVRNGAKRIPMGLAFAIAVAFLHQAATAQINLGTASSFGLLAGSAITDAGGASTITKGNVGVYPGTADGLSSAQVTTGTIYRRTGDDVLLNTAKNDLFAAYTAAANAIPFTTLPGGDNQLGLAGTLGPGVYRFPTATTANLIGTLTLDAHGVASSVWIFQASADFVAQSGSVVSLINGASPCNVFWEVATSTTIGTSSRMAGIIMADQAIAFGSTATLNGSAMTRVGAITLDHNTITDSCVVPEPGSTLLLGFGLATLVVFRRRSFSPA